MAYRGRQLQRGGYRDYAQPGPSNYAEEYEYQQTPRGRGSRGHFPRSRGNRGNKSNFNNNWNKSKNETEKPENTKQQETLPVPQHLSKKDSEFKNDPLYCDSFFEEMGGELRRKPDDPKIHSEATGLKFLIENSYKVYITKSAGFAKRMTESALAYYFSQLTLARLCELHANNSFDVDYETSKFIEQIKKASYYVPKSLARYLSGFGNTKVPSGRTLKFEFPLVNQRTVRANGLTWPGRVSELTHFLYKSYPVSAVYAMRILQDLIPPQPPRRRREDEEEEEEVLNDQEWDLPARVRPQGWNGAVPNENMMGWRYKERLSNTQVSWLNEAGVFEGIFESLNEKWNYNPTLMNAISIELQNLQWIEAGEYPSSISGSQGQLTFSTFYGEPNIVEVMGEFEGRSDVEIPGPIALPGVRHLYRVQHDALIRNWSVYWDDAVFEHVPELWVNTINNLRNGELVELGLTRYTTELFQPREFARLVVDKDNKRDVKKK